MAVLNSGGITGVPVDTARLRFALPSPRAPIQVGSGHR